MARIEDTYARDYYANQRKSIAAWALGAYNPQHEQIDLNGAPDATSLQDATWRNWALFVGVSLALWGAAAIVTAPLWRHP